MTEHTAETFRFEVEVKQLLNLVIHSLYSHPEIFLRELISNAADAQNKLRFLALENDALYEGDSEQKIQILIDKAQNTITIRDNGIGMSREEVQTNLGMIAKSGTKEFLSALTGDKTKDANLIGQFGVGFYSAFIVADKVTVLTRRAGCSTAEGVCWVSDGTGEYSIEITDKATHGTDVILHLKKDQEEFLDDWRLRNIIKKYSDHIAFPIEMQKPVFEDKDDEKTDEPKAPEWETVNKAKALWTVPKSELSENDYNEFYKYISHDFEDPLTHTHNKVEGDLNYTSLLYLPAKAPFNLWNREEKHGLKLFVQRVFIMDDAEQFLPLYLRFVKGVVDCADLPLNVSREILQSDHTVRKIRSALIKRVFQLIEKMAEKEPEKFQTFYNTFGQVLKEGVIEDFSNKDAIAKLLRFSSTHAPESTATVSLADYVSRMQPEQEHIYYLTAENFNAAKNSPHLEIFRQKNIEVLLLHDRIDEWLVGYLTEFDGKTLQSVAKGNLDLGKLEDKPDEEKQKEQEKTFASMVEQIKKILGETVKDVRITYRLTDSPACLVVDDDGMSAHLQRMMQQAGQAMPASKPILELNPEHVLIKRLQAETDDAQFESWTRILFDQATLAEGGTLEAPADFVKRLNAMWQALV